MSEPEHEPDAVPDSVLGELQAAFSHQEPPPEKGYDFDDPSIDRLLGLTPAAGDDAHPADPSAAQPDEAGPADESAPIVVDDDDVPIEGDEPTPAAPARRTTIVIGGGEEDELPDTVYLDEELETRLKGDSTSTSQYDPERSTVVIGDLDDGRAVQPAPSAGSAGMDPRIRARRIANRRAEGRRRLVWVGVASGVVLLVIAAIAVVASPIFDVEDVQVQGAVYTDQDVLQEVIDSIQGEPVLLVDTRKAEQTLEAVPWVERAKVTTDFPHGARIDIRERKALATFQGADGRFRVIDVQGRVLDVLEGQPIAYPLVVGDNPDSQRGQFAGAPYAAAAELVVSMPADIRRVLVSLGVNSSTGTLSITLRSPDDGDDADVEVALGDAKHLDDKLARLLYQVRRGDGLAGVCSIDVSTAEVGVVPGC